ncbi:MAG: hypothetical protein ABI333_01495 [bacterium]
MANTKKQSREERKASKRKARGELKKLFGTLNRKQRRTLRAEPQGLRTFIAKQEKAE